MSTNISSGEIECSYGPFSVSSWGKFFLLGKKVLLRIYKWEKQQAHFVVAVKHFFGSEELLPWLRLVSDMYLLVPVEFLFVLWDWNRCQTECWKGEELWEREMKLGSSKGQRNWNSSLDDWGSLKCHFPSPALLQYSKTNLGLWKPFLSFQV